MHLREMESKEAGRTPDDASCNSSSENGNPAELLLTSNGNGKSATLVINASIHGKPALVSTNGPTNGDSTLVPNGIGNLTMVTPSTAVAAKQVQQQQCKSGWIPKTLSFRPYVHLSVNPSGRLTGRLANGILVCTGRVANGFHVEEPEKITEVTRNCPLVVNKLTKGMIETYRVCNPDQKWSVQAPKGDLTTPSKGFSNDHGRIIVENNLVGLKIDHPEGYLSNPSGEVSNDHPGRENLENDLNVPQADLLTNPSKGVGSDGPDGVEDELTTPSEGVSNDPGRGNVENDPSILQADPPKRYLTNPSEGVRNDGRDNVDHDLILQVDDVLVNSTSNVSYVVKDMLGKGSFGQVCKCWTSNPMYQRENVAVKIIKNRNDFRNLAEVEKSICKLLNVRDPYDTSNIVQFLESFVFAGHLCLVFELLSIDLHELLRLNSFGGLSIKVVRRLTGQILEALTALEAAGVMHCDLKPENIVLHPGPLEEFTEKIIAALEALRNAGDDRPDQTEKEIILNSVFLESYARIKLIDFGLASSNVKTFSAGGRNAYIQSRHYRSPEVVLKLAYTPAMDMWSLGCVAAELFLGIPLFPGANEYDLFRFMIDILGRQPPDEIIFASGDEIRGRFFKLANRTSSPSKQASNGRSINRPLVFTLLSEADVEARVRAYGLGKPKAEKRYFNRMTLEDIIMNKQARLNRMTEEEMAEEISCHAAFLDFLTGVLHFDFRRRWTPRQALRHPFVTGEQYIGPFSPPDFLVHRRS